MVEKILFITTWMLATASTVFSQSSEKIAVKKQHAEVVLRTKVPVEVEKDSTNTAYSEFSGGRIFSLECLSNKTREMKFAFVPTADGEAVFELRAAGGKGLSVYFSAIKGTLATDFSKGWGGWERTVGSPLIVENPLPSSGGVKCARVSTGARISRKIKLAKGEKIEFSARVNCADGWEDVYALDLSKAANADFKAASEKMPAFQKVKTPKTGRVYGKMKFRVINPDSNGGASAILLSRKDQGTTIEFSGTLPRGKYVYLLHTAGNDANGFIGRIRAKFADGRDRVLSVHCYSDVGRADSPIKPYDNALPVHLDDKKKKTGALYLSRFDLAGADRLSDLASLRFELVRNAHWMILGATVSSREVDTTELMKFDPDVWKPLDGDSLEVVDGSALDLSAFVEKGAPAGKFGKVVIGKNGGFAFENKPDEKVRFKSANFFGLICNFGKGIKTHEQIDKYVRMLKKQGFNAIRWRLVMGGNSEFDAPYKLKPLNRDLYDYFLYALAREGLYSFFYLCSHDTGDPSFKWNDRFTVKVKMMFGDPATREAWRKLAKMQLEHVNPYTGKAWKDDPSIAGLEYWNEFELGIVVYNAITQEGRNLVNKKFAEYLAKHYKTPADFLKYCDEIGKPWVFTGAFDKFEQVDVSPYPNRSGNPVYARFIIGAMEDMQAFCEKVVRDEIGMKVPTHQNNCLKNVYWTYLSSEGGSYTAVNTYHAHPSSYSLGAEVSQASSITNAGNYWRGSVVKRVAGMPIAVTEYQHCYFNKYIHEAGVLFPAYSAFQGYDSLVAFDSPVALKAGRFGFFGIGTNPVFRANDFLTFFLFYRGDVKQSPHRVDIVYDRDFFEKSRYTAYSVNDEQSRISLMTGFALSFPSGRKLDEVKAVQIKPADLSMTPAGASEVEADLNFANIGKAFGSNFKAGDIIADLKKRGILPQDNISDPANGVFQTDTGEITMDIKKRRLSVITPKSVAAVLNASEGAKLGAFEVKSMSLDSAVALVSLDDKPLDKSDRMVLVVSTDALPSGVGLSCSRKKLTAWGKPSMILQTGKLSAELKVEAGKKFVLYPLKLTGERLAEIPCENADGVLKIELDTSKHPAVFFELQSK